MFVFFFYSKIGVVTLFGLGMRRLPLTPWESNVVNRLQQPTHSYLARSRSAMSLSGEQTGNATHPPSLYKGPFLLLLSSVVGEAEEDHQHTQQLTVPL